ncbi:MAG: SET domain-containing protein-lysine N-methyltransferase [Syntrophaceae bacterium]|nr:SET domain-containing protein-lysine N-methyltransferase [Syntrophaceae bacterium]
MLSLYHDPAGYGLGMKAGRFFYKNQIVYQIKNYKITNQPDYRTIQIDTDKHISNLDTLAYLNHSCNPNVIVDVMKMALIALRDIAKGEIITYFYPSTEWNMARPFHCRCNSILCLGYISGAKTVPRNVLEQYFINPHIQQMIQTYDQNANLSEFVTRLKA